MKEITCDEKKQKLGRSVPCRGLLVKRQRAMFTSPGGVPTVRLGARGACTRQRRSARGIQAAAGCQHQVGKAARRNNRPTRQTDTVAERMRIRSTGIVYITWRQTVTDIFVHNTVGRRTHVCWEYPIWTGELII